MKLNITVEPEDETLFNNLEYFEVELQAEYEDEKADYSVGFQGGFYVTAFNYEKSKYSLAEIEEIEKAIDSKRQLLTSIVFYMYENGFDCEKEMRKSFKGLSPSYIYMQPQYA